MEQQMNIELGKWNLPTQALKQITDLVKQDWREATEEHVEGDLELHEKSAGLIGLWTNKTVQKIVKDTSKTKRLDRGTGNEQM